MNNKIHTAIQIDRVWAMPNKNTFSIKPIHNLIEKEITEGLWIDPFANENKFATITNDLNPKFNTDYHIDALEFLKLFNFSSESFKDFPTTDKYIFILDSVPEGLTTNHESSSNIYFNTLDLGNLIKASYKRNLLAIQHLIEVP